MAEKKEVAVIPYSNFAVVKSDPSVMKEEIRSQTAQTVLLKRMGEPKDVAGLVLFLASDWALLRVPTNMRT